jgi:hypothetical protein
VFPAFGGSVSTPTPALFGWLVASQQCFSLTPIQHQSLASQQYFFLTTNQSQLPAISQPNETTDAGGDGAWHSRAAPVRELVKLCSLSHSNLKYFLFLHLSHQIFRRMHEALNVGKKITNCIVCL